MKADSIVVDGRLARIWSGGEGDALVLVHGAWALAEAHWGPVWDRLAERYRVIAPDLPRVTSREGDGPHSFAEYADWLARVLDAVEIRDAWIVGNSFGAGITWCFGAKHRDRCRGLVFVAGGPPPSVPRPVRWLLSRPVVRARVKRMFGRRLYSAETGPRAFVDTARIPAAVAAAFVQEHPPQLDTMYDVMLGGGTAAKPDGLPMLLLWGDGDRLFGTAERAARRTHAAMPQAKLAFIPRAGHLPQVENPDAFIEALTGFVDANRVRT